MQQYHCHTKLLWWSESPFSISSVKGWTPLFHETVTEETSVFDGSCHLYDSVCLSAVFAILGKFVTNWNATPCSKVRKIKNVITSHEKKIQTFWSRGHLWKNDYLIALFKKKILSNKKNSNLFQVDPHDILEKCLWRENLHVYVSASINAVWCTKVNQDR